MPTKARKVVRIRPAPLPRTVPVYSMTEADLAAIFAKCEADIESMGVAEELLFRRSALALPVQARAVSLAAYVVAVFLEMYPESA